MKSIKNDLLLKALRGENVSRPPVWMMRQAGRYLPEYLKIRDKYSFFTRVQTPELACEITMQPIYAVDPDAAIIFSDILVIPQSMGIDVRMEENKGPLLINTIHSEQCINNLKIEGNIERLDYVFEAIKLTKRELNNKIPLIGFAGAPFTILCYMVEGKGSKDFSKAKKFCFTQPRMAARLLEIITSITIDYLKNQVLSGVDCVQIFDSWSGLLSPEDFETYSLPYLMKITDELSKLCPVILFPKGSWHAIKYISNSKASAVGIDWCISPLIARELTNNRIAIQGNLDPLKLLLSPKEIEKEVTNMINEFGVNKYVANLGHGILPYTPVENARAFINAVKQYKGI